MSYSPPTSTERIVAVLAYIVERVQDKGPHSVLKTLYAAEKTHLEKYAATILEGTYVAMEYGPVHSTLLDLIHQIQRPNHKFALSEELISHTRRHLTVVDGNLKASATPVDLGVLSESELDALDEAIALLDGMSFKERTEWSHDAAWDRAVARAPNSRNASMEWEDIIDTIPNAGTIKGHIRDPFPN